MPGFRCDEPLSTPWLLRCLPTHAPFLAPPFFSCILFGLSCFHSTSCASLCLPSILPTFGVSLNLSLVVSSFPAPLPAGFAAGSTRQVQVELERCYFCPLGAPGNFSLWMSSSAASPCTRLPQFSLSTPPLSLTARLRVRFRPQHDFPVHGRTDQQRLSKIVRSLPYFYTMSLLSPWCYVHLSRVILKWMWPKEISCAG